MSQVCSIFSQLLKLFPRSEFEQAVRQHRGERHARGFTCWGQFGVRAESGARKEGTHCSAVVW